MSKDLIKIAMILEDGDTAAVSPVMAITYDVLSAVNKIDSYKLLFIQI